MKTNDATSPANFAFIIRTSDLRLLNQLWLDRHFVNAQLLGTTGFRIELERTEAAKVLTASLRVLAGDSPALSAPAARRLRTLASEIEVFLDSTR